VGIPCIERCIGMIRSQPDKKNSLSLADLVIPKGDIGGDTRNDEANSLLHLSILIVQQKQIGRVQKKLYPKEGKGEFP
jgi:hypothetical protein